MAREINLSEIRRKKPELGKYFDNGNLLHFIDYYIKDLQDQRDLLSVHLDRYKEATKNAKIIDGDIKLEDLFALLVMPVPIPGLREIWQDGKQDEDIGPYSIEQAAENGDIYRLDIIFDGGETGDIITKESGDHTLLRYNELGKWEASSWEECYGYTYSQYEVLVEKDAKACMLDAALKAGSMTDEEMEKMFMENAGLLELWNAGGVFCYTDAGGGRILLVPNDTDIKGAAIYEKNGELILARYLVDFIQKDNMEPVDIFEDVSYLTKGRAAAFVQKYFNIRTGYGEVCTLNPTETGGCVMISAAPFGIDV